MKPLISAIAAFATLVSFAAGADVPFTFHSVTPAYSWQLNQNFRNLDWRVNASLGGIIIRRVSASSGTGVASVSCPTNSLVVSANCHCDPESNTRNYGVLFGCTVAGNGGVVGCFPEGVTYDPTKPMPNAYLNLECISARTNAGNEIIPVPISATEPVVQKTSKENSDLLEAEIKRVQDQVDDFTTILNAGK